MQSKIVHAITFALAEYFLIVLPVLIFIVLDATQSRHWSKMWDSPEWAIAILFLVLRLLFLHYMLLHRIGRRLNEQVLLLFALGGLCLSTAATVNLWSSLNSNSNSAIALRLTLLLIASIAFFVSVGGGYYQLALRKE